MSYNVHLICVSYDEAIGAMPGVFNPQEAAHWPEPPNGRKAPLPRSGNIRHGLQTQDDCDAFGVPMPQHH